MKACLQQAESDDDEQKRIGTHNGTKKQCFEAVRTKCTRETCNELWCLPTIGSNLVHQTCSHIHTPLLLFRQYVQSGHHRIVPLSTNKPTHLTPLLCLIANAAKKGGASERSQPVQPGSLCPPLGRQRSLFHRGPAVSLPREGAARGRAGACHGRQASRHFGLWCCAAVVVLALPGKELERSVASVSVLSTRGRCSPWHWHVHLPHERVRDQHRAGNLTSGLPPRTASPKQPPSVLPNHAPLPPYLCNQP